MTGGDVKYQMLKLHISKSAGPGTPYGRVAKELAEDLPEPLMFICNTSWHSREVPEDWKKLLCQYLKRVGRAAQEPMGSKTLRVTVGEGRVLFILTLWDGAVPFPHSLE